MTDDKRLDAATLRWAAQHIRKFMTGHTHDAKTADEWDAEVACNAQTSAFEFAAESMDNWAVEAELEAAKEMPMRINPATVCLSASACTNTKVPGSDYCPSCGSLERQAYDKRFAEGLAASLAEAELLEKHAGISNSDTVRVPSWASPWEASKTEHTVDQAAIEHYGRIAYESLIDNYDSIDLMFTWPSMASHDRLPWIIASKAVCVEMIRAWACTEGKLKDGRP